MIAMQLHTEVRGSSIIVSLPGTSYVVTYYKSAAFPQQLITKSHSGDEERHAPMTQAEFFAGACALPTTRLTSWVGSRERQRAAAPRIKKAPANVAWGFLHSTSRFVEHSARSELPNYR
jgi:hypothetical protein